jgi:hypothetical protein
MAGSDEQTLPALDEEMESPPSADAPPDVDAARAVKEPTERPAAIVPEPEADLEKHVGEQVAAKLDWAPPEVEITAEQPPAEGSLAAKPTAQPSVTPIADPPRLSAVSTLLRPATHDNETNEVVGWALEGLMSSVKSVWGVALTRVKRDVCFVQRGIELESAHPDLWEWLKKTIDENGDDKAWDSPPPSQSGTLAWAQLRSNSVLVGTVVLGREGDADPFSASDQSWLHKVGERIASILCSTEGSALTESADREPSEPSSVWAAPVLERAGWAGGWMREQFEASGCWLFVAMEDSSEPRLIDESWGSVSPPFLANTIRAAMERSQAQVWLDEAGDKALVLQPLGPWGLRWVVVLEGVPWRGDGRSTLARLKKAAVTLSKLLRSN